jgi:hypothetical protein
MVTLSPLSHATIKKLPEGSLADKARRCYATGLSEYMPAYFTPKYRMKV